MSAVASSFDTFGGKPFNIAALEGKTCRLRNTTMDSNCASSTLVFSAAITAFSNGNNLLFLQLVYLSSELMCLPASNVTVKFLFSTIRAIKSKLRNLLAIPMVDAILRTRNGLFKV